MAGREIRDPIHGFIRLEDGEVKIIDNPIFQRLRRIKQLAFAHLVYPGALHTRFDHSLGAGYVAASMGRALGLGDGEERRWLRRAALLHDLGHGPFSHVSENLLARFAEPTIIEGHGLEEIHELITMQLIKGLSFLEELDRERIIGLLLSEDKAKRPRMVKFLKVHDWPPDPLLKQIISGPLDADKQDYLLRDSYFCGVKYGVFDIARLHNTLETDSEPHEGNILAISEDGVHAVEQYVMAKYYMNTQVYRHRVRRITDAMLTRAMTLGIEMDRIPFLKDLYTYDGSDKFLQNYVEWDDERVTREILQTTGKACELFKRLRERRLFKQIYSKNLNQLEVNIREALSKLSQTQKGELEKKVGETLGFDPLQVMVDVYRIKSAREQVEGSEGRIRVKGKENFQKESALFSSIDIAMQDQYVEIYAPAEYTSEKDKQEKRTRWNGEVERIFEDTLKGDGP